MKKAPKSSLFLFVSTLRWRAHSGFRVRVLMHLYVSFWLIFELFLFLFVSTVRWRAHSGFRVRVLMRLYVSFWLILAHFGSFCCGLGSLYS